MASYDYRINALTSNGAAHVFGYDATNTCAGNIVEAWDGPNSGSQRWAVHSDGDVIPGPATPADLGTTATDGFVYIRTCNGVPTGTPTHATNGLAPLVLNRATGDLYIYNGGWIKVTLS